MLKLMTMFQTFMKSGLERLFYQGYGLEKKSSWMPDVVQEELPKSYLK